MTKPYQHPLCKTALPANSALTRTTINQQTYKSSTPPYCTFNLLGSWHRNGFACRQSTSCKVPTLATYSLSKKRSLLLFSPPIATHAWAFASPLELLSTLGKARRSNPSFAGSVPSKGLVPTLACLEEARGFRVWCRVLQVLVVGYYRVNGVGAVRISGFIMGK